MGASARRGAVMAMALVFLVQTVVASVYTIHNAQMSAAFSNPFDFALQRAEKMFATDKGPFLGVYGESRIDLEIEGLHVTPNMDGWKVVVFHYHADDLSFLTSMEENIYMFACSPEKQIFSTDGSNHFSREEFMVMNRLLMAKTSYKVLTSGWIDTVVVVCTKEGSRAEDALNFTGTLTVRNPYGLLPAVFYGLLPFSGFLALGYLVLAIFFGLLLVCYRKTLIRLQHGIFSVLGLGVASSSIWFLALTQMNDQGEPFRWPLPPLYITAVVFDVGMRTFARSLLLVVCLGYGIVRNFLPPVQKWLIVVLSVAYFGTGVGDDLWRDGLLDYQSAHRRPSVWSFLQLLCNLSFVLWIYVALETILKELQVQKQSAKLNMYKSLAWALGGFVVFFAILTIVSVCGRFGVFEWKIEWEWMQLVAWPVLNFIVSLAMCVIWRPTARSSQFAFSTQLPMTEAADDSDDETDVEMASARRSVPPTFTKSRARPKSPKANAPTSSRIWSCRPSL
ncbi:hypothetical protein H310_10430 [Aphanomyces invadans]|uniref:GOST seven transmembrane domain-containing protein n=1 Tax=Aphanomyces invadans TaxID=157072 RepID=A0A024TRI8_9STRA|nr:hypothetical protein H310_10430 [Aphanomyces invadans]ETV96246.1 hypothetical protein H310_10430 [Aphanomyces invadans]|eukprot:XP_008875038.1 hypothetical protein H310_10430 [Aphanomyces invadans]